MTELDKFEPEGEPIHPFDLYELIKTRNNTRIDLIATITHDWKAAPTSVDEADYQRNRHKIGTIHTINGKKYFETTSIETVTKSIA